VENPASPDLRRCRRPPRLYRIAVIVLAAGPLFAEKGGNDPGEFPAFSGMALGGTGPHPAVGGSAGTSLSRFTMALLEASVIPLRGAPLLPRGPVKIRGFDLFDFNFALQARVPARNCRIDEFVPSGNSRPVGRGSLLGQPPLQIWPGRRGGCAVLRRGGAGHPCIVPIYFVRDNLQPDPRAASFISCQMTPSSRFATAPDVTGGISLCYSEASSC
jgi:hypothetical protein